jgi:hypothetical protein
MPASKKEPSPFAQDASALHSRIKAARLRDSPKERGWATLLALDDGYNVMPGFNTWRDFITTMLDHHAKPDGDWLLALFGSRGDLPTREETDWIILEIAATFAVQAIRADTVGALAEAWGFAADAEKWCSLLEGGTGGTIDAIYLQKKAVADRLPKTGLLTGTQLKSDDQASDRTLRRRKKAARPTS